MPIGIMQWRVEIGMFFRKFKVQYLDRILLPTIRPLFCTSTPDEFDSFINNLEKLAIDIYSGKADFVLMIGDFNAKSCNWWTNDTATPEGAQLDSITSLYGMKQLISEPTHILRQSSSCIDLIFTNQPNIAMDSAVDSFLHSKCHHQIIYSKLSLKIEYPPPYPKNLELQQI